MNYLNLDKTKLINLSYSLNQELIRSNHAGSYACTSIISANTRKYHGLLVCPLEYLDGGYHVLLSGLHETIIQHDKEFNLGMHKYAGDYYNPRGHKYLMDFEADPTSRLVFRVGGVILSRETMLAQHEERVMIRYTLIDAHSPTLIRFKPFMVFRNVHALSKANDDVITKTHKISNGIRTRMYNGYPYLYMQFSKKNEFIPEPVWNYNVEYIMEQKRGYDYKEDLFVPGFFELPMKKGETVIFSAGTTETEPQGLKKKFEAELEKRIPRNTLHNSLLNASRQFLAHRDRKTSVMPGFPWHRPSLRITFGSLPGLTLHPGDMTIFKSALDNGLSDLLKSFNAAALKSQSHIFRGIDEPLWFIWALQQYDHRIEDNTGIWKSYGNKIKLILGSFREGIGDIVSMRENGLLYCSETDIPLTWMDSIVDGRPVNPRSGYIVEVNALWYNALEFSLRLAEVADDKVFVRRWEELPALVSTSFGQVFGDEGKGYLADYVRDDSADWSVRPNQVLAASLPYSPIDNDMKQKMLEVITSELLTPKGLRTLAPKNPGYLGIYDGDQAARDTAAHQGSVYPWLLGHYAEAYLRLYRKSGVDHISNLFYGFNEDMEVHGIGTVSELYDGNPPHYPDGAISYAWNVAELLRMEQLILYYKSI
jgi:predicted glycogen debranching enzyme